MAEPEVLLDTALKQVSAAWDPARTERTLEGAQRKQAQQRTRAVALATAAAALLVVGGAYGAYAALGSDRSITEALAHRPAEPERAVNFADGSKALLLDAAAQVIVERASDAAIDVRLPSGRARFEVSQHKARTFRVLCDEVTVQVIGTGFELTRQGARTHVSVQHGRVAVSWPSGRTELGAGQSGWFPATAAASVPAQQTATQQPLPKAVEHESARAMSWRQHAEQGEFQEAYRMLPRDRARISDDVEELLLAADAARLSGHADEAVPFLQRVVDRHAQDPRAPLAAFTLGGVLMNQLGRPREAEASYARARAMSPSSALSQDALARQVEAAHRASDAAAARALALEYLEQYPAGRRIQAVRRFGGLP